MNKKTFLIFFSVVFVIYFLINYYIFMHGWNAFPRHDASRTIYAITFSLLFISYILSRFLERTALVKVSEPFTWIGSFWLAAMFYFFLIVLLVDFIRLLDYWFAFLPEYFYCSCGAVKLLTFYYAIGIVFLAITAGFINARNPKIKRLSLAVNKKAKDLKKLNIVAVSDIHMGMLVKHRMISRLVRIIKKLNPDIVLIVGDMVDEDVAPVMKFNLGEPFKTIQVPFGIYAISGNHELIGGSKKAFAYIESLGIKVLKDEVVKIADSFYLAGRCDNDMQRFTGVKRKSVDELLQNIDPSLPLILLDHQPFHLEIAEQCGVDLQLSGHTHHGQIWPLHYITKKIFELSWGYKKKGNTHFYVSSGFGTWGPPVRIGNRPEVLNIELNFLQ